MAKDKVTLMNNLKIITFNKSHAIEKGMEVLLRLGGAFENTNHLREEIHIPRMIDITGNKYYLTNINKYLAPEYMNINRISVEVMTDGVTQTALLEWLDQFKVKCHITEEPEDENTS
jgi:hypothetical protein